MVAPPFGQFTRDLLEGSEPECLFALLASFRVHCPPNKPATQLGKRPKTMPPREWIRGGRVSPLFSRKERCSLRIAFAAGFDYPRRRRAAKTRANANGANEPGVGINQIDAIWSARPGPPVCGAPDCLFDGDALL